MPSSTKKKRHVKVLQLNKNGFLHHLKIIATHGLFEQGGEIATRILKDSAYWKRGSERIPLSDEEAGKLLFHKQPRRIKDG